MPDYLAAAYNLIDKNLGLKNGEELLVVASRGKEHLTQAVEAACADRGVGFSSAELAEESAYELPDSLRSRLLTVTAALISTERSYTHTDGVRAAAAAGARIATNSRLTQEQLATGLMVDYQVIAERARHYAALLEAASEVTVRSGANGELHFTIAHQPAFAETGLYRQAGEVGNLPAGEAACGIDDGSGQGVLIVAGSWPGLGLLDSPLELTFEAGMLVAVAGSRAAELEAILEEHGSAGRLLAELGIGVNSALVVQGNTLLDEKVAGTVHIAVGNDVTFGGSNSVGYHADGVVTGPTLLLDGVQITLP